MTLIQAGNSNGVYGRCDSKCQDAQDRKCQCICGGRYHGLKSYSTALTAAVRQTEGKWVEELERQGAGVKVLKRALANPDVFILPMQEELFR